MVTSVEEAVEAQKKKSALNRFYWSLLQQNKNSSSSRVGYDESNKRDVGEKVMVSFTLSLLLSMRGCFRLVTSGL